MSKQTYKHLPALESEMVRGRTKFQRGTKDLN